MNMLLPNLRWRILTLSCLIYLSPTRAALADETLPPPKLLPLARVSLSFDGRIPLQEEKPPLSLRYSEKQLKGWHYLIERLADQGFSEPFLVDLFSDKRIPKRDTLYFSLTPSESRARYRSHLNSSRRRNAISFYRRNQTYFEDAALRFDVPQSIILSILQVETNCGLNTGKNGVFYRLARLASAAAPENIERNYRKHKRSGSQTLINKVWERAKVLESTFLPHLVGTLLLAAEKGTDPLEIRGSSSGAIGIPQFLPGNRYLFGVDGDGDGDVNLFDDIDAIYSVANFLKLHGWKPNLSLSEQKQVIWEYNRSSSYVDTIVQLANLLEREIRISKSTK